MHTTIYMAMSLDGYIAKLNNATPWSEAEWDKFNEMVKHTGNLVIGRKTYDIMKADNDFKSFTSSPFVVVLSSNPTSVEENDSVQCVGTVEMALQAISKRGYSQALVCGGTQTNQSFLAANVIDEVHIDIEPILLGRGIPFLNMAGELKLQLNVMQQLDEGVVHLEYGVIK